MSSWWETSGFSSMASQAIKSAQKHIDKVLDIPVEEQQHKGSTMKKTSSAASTADGDSFWDAYLDSSPSSSKDVNKEKPHESKSPSPNTMNKSTVVKPQPLVMSTSTPKLEIVQKETITTDTSMVFNEPENILQTGDYYHEISSMNKSGSDFSEISEAEFSDHSNYNQSLNSSKLGFLDLIDTEAQKELETPDRNQVECDKEVTHKDDVSENISAQSEDRGKNHEMSDICLAAEISREESHVEKEVAHVQIIDAQMEAAKNNVKEGWAVDSLVLDEQLQDMMKSKVSDSPLLKPVDGIDTNIQEDDNVQKNIEEIDASKHAEIVLNVSNCDNDSEGDKYVCNKIADTTAQMSDSGTVSETKDTGETSQVQCKLGIEDITLQQLERNASNSTISEDLSDSNRTITAESSDSDKAGINQDSSMVITSIDSVTILQEADSQHHMKTEHSDHEQSSDSTGSFIQAGKEFIESTLSNVSDSSSNSFVKNMLEEAMVESAKDNDSHSSVSTERSSSDMVRIESGLNSDQTSGDEIDTTTSSDIEIISTPTPNGENSHNPFKPVDLSPLRHAFKGLRRSSPPRHKRSDSGSSSQSRNGDDMLQEGRIAALCSPDEGSEYRHKDGVDEYKLSPSQVDRLLKKMGEMAEILDARERKLLEMSKQNMDLQEANSILRNQLQQSEDAREIEMTDLNKVTAEFTNRIGDFEKKLQSAAKEKEAMKKKIKQLEDEVIKKSDNSAMETLLREKEEQVSELLGEGEKLSKQQLQSNNIIKKLRTKEKENESVLKSQKEKVEKQKTEIEKLTNVLNSKDELEKMQSDSIGQLNSAVQIYERQIAKLKSDLDEAQDKNRSLQVTLDKTYKEIAELHKANVSRASEAQEAALSAEMQVKQELQLALDRSQQQAKYQQEALINQVEDLRLSLSRMEKEHSRREDVLRQEISDLQQRLQDAESRNEELSQSVTQATRPLLRQIENLQSTYTAQTSSYEKVEKNLTERLSEAQTQLAGAVENERAVNEQLIEVSAKLKALESQLSITRQEKGRLSAQYEMEKTKVEMLEESKHSEAVQQESLKHMYVKDLSEVKKERLLLENQLEIERMKTESEKKKVQLAHEQLKEKEMLLQTARAAVPSSPVYSREPSVTSDTSITFLPITQDEVLEKTLMISSPNGSKSNLYETLRQTGAATLLESLQSQLKQREGEIIQLQSDISELEHTREAMARELVNVSSVNDALEEKCKELPELQSQHQDLSQRYNALLQMYGEKTEEADELKLDLQDVKDMYRSQINDLLKNQ